MDSVIIRKPDTGELELKYSDIEKVASDITITSQEDMVRAKEVMGIIKSLKKELDDTFDPAIKQAFKAHRAMKAAKDKYFKPLIKLEKKIKIAISNFVLEQEEKARREKQRMLEEARKRAAMEAKKKAEEALDEGDLDRAIAFEEESKDIQGLVVTPNIPVSKPKVDGLVTRDDWKFEVVDPSALPREYLMPDERKIAKVVRAMKGDTKIPGVRVWKKVISYSR